ncbi:acyl carrier protein [Streptomyces sp. NPDC006235]|uniref:acyl carrier protein n=1 Tax=Streptomyces sp. NPDC006235 TaxID=3156736 RepID=UPI0033A3084F
MTATEFTLTDLKRILREGAGADESVDLDGDIDDISFENLGYESLALLETGTRIEREYGITLQDSDLAVTRTPRALIGDVNALLHRDPQGALRD